MTYTTEFVQVVNDIRMFVPGRHEAREAIADALPDQVCKTRSSDERQPLAVPIALTILVVAEGVEQRQHAADFEVPCLG